MNSFSRIAVGAVALCASVASSAGAITDWEGTGVDFYSSWLDADTLRIEIDAGVITTGSGWADAMAIDSIAINGPDAWTWVNASDIDLDGPESFGGSVDGSGLNAGGCQDLTLGGNHQCWSGLATLTDNMYFDFTFSGDAVISDYTETPHLKVRFVDEGGDKVGSLLSQDLVADVPEPASLALLGLGLVGLGFARRKSTT